MEKHKGKTTIEGKVSERATSSVGKNSKEGKTKLPDSSANGDKISVESKESESSTDTEGSN